MRKWENMKIKWENERWENKICNVKMGFEKIRK